MKVAVYPYNFGFVIWSLGGSTGSVSAGGLYDELMVDDYAMDVEDVAYYYSSMLMSPVEITVNCSNEYQTRRKFGSSAAWHAVGWVDFGLKRRKIVLRNCFSAKNWMKMGIRKV